MAASVPFCLLSFAAHANALVTPTRSAMCRIAMVANDHQPPQSITETRRRHRAVLTSSRNKRQLAQIQQQKQELQELQELAQELALSSAAAPLPSPASRVMEGGRSGSRSSLGGGGIRSSSSSSSSSSVGAGGIAGEQALFRHRFLVSSDLCIRLPIEAATLLRAFVVHSHLAGVVHLQLESFRPISKVNLCPDAKRMASMPNAGGSSLLSEVLAFELLARAFGASLERTETELDYAPGSKLTDFAITIFGGYPLGVSVTRAYKWRGGHADPSGLDVYDARRLLIKKLAAINVSSQNLLNYRWRKQLLVVWAFTHRDAMLLENTYKQVPAELRANTVLLITRCNGVNWIR